MVDSSSNSRSSTAPFTVLNPPDLVPVAALANTMTSSLASRLTLSSQSMSELVRLKLSSMGVVTAFSREGSPGRAVEGAVEFTATRRSARISSSVHRNPPVIRERSLMCQVDWPKTAMVCVWSSTSALIESPGRATKPMGIPAGRPGRELRSCWLAMVIKSSPRNT